MHVLARILTASLVLAVLPLSAGAQQYPAQDIHVICAYPAGSGADIFVRWYAEKLKAVAGRTVIVENKPGAISNVATEYVSRARPDGHVIYIQGASSIGANMHLFKNPPVDVSKAFEVVGTLSQQPVMLAKRGGHLVHDAAWRTRDMVLRPLTRCRERGAVHVEPVACGGRGHRSDLERRGRADAFSLRNVGRDQHTQSVRRRHRVPR